MNEIYLVDTIDNVKIELINDSLLLSNSNLKIIVSDSKHNNNSDFFGLTQEQAQIIFPTTVTILIFAIGILATWIKRKLERKSNLLLTRKAIIEWIRLLKYPVGQQVVSCTDFSDKLLNLNDFQLEKFEYNSMLMNKIQEIDIKSYFESFVLNLKDNKQDNSKNLFNIVSQIESLCLLEKETLKKYEIYHEYSSKLIDVWNNYWQEFEQLRVAIRTDLYGKTKEPEYSFYRDLDQLCATFYKSVDANVSSKEIVENLLQKVSDLSGKAIDSNPGHKYPHMIFSKTFNLIFTYKRVEKNNIGTSEVFKAFANKINQSYSVAFETCDKVEKANFKSLVYIK